LSDTVPTSSELLPVGSTSRSVSTSTLLAKPACPLRAAPPLPDAFSCAGAHARRRRGARQRAARGHAIARTRERAVRAAPTPRWRRSSEGLRQSNASAAYIRPRRCAQRLRTRHPPRRAPCRVWRARGAARRTRT
jgi:hypothetical protein